jgi:HlyD family secretion protein
MFKFLLKFFAIGGVLLILIMIGLTFLGKSIAERNKPRWRTAAVKKGDITKIVNATGTVKPVKSVQVGSFVSGPIQELYVKFNQEVKANELLAKIDPRLFQANVDRDKAIWRTRKAELDRVKAMLQQAVNDESRAVSLREENEDFIAQSELDQVKFSRISLEAQIKIAEASIDQAKASLSNSEQNLDYTEIRAPEDGMIIDRKVEPGQTLAAQFQTPELFVVGVGMREKMHVFADVDESEIGLIRDAAKTEQPVNFTVDAYPDDLFIGLIEEVRFSSAETQNVVTYPVIVGAANPELKLLPGMTANLSFQVKQKKDVIKIPKAALRFYPPDPKFVHPDDRKILEGAGFDTEEKTEPESGIRVESGGPGNNPEKNEDEIDESTAEERVKANQNAKRRHVWTFDGEFLRAIEVKVGLNDNRFAELISGDVGVDTQLVTGQKAKGEK